ncbi:TetR/AcrR family transcriptional regulator C-terminal domain-containing protein [Amycolatopsis suaedae]|uniref:TetR/AcrR family transcriptional regulator C-terminal domain-containing protein n=1 Tax=Amycolatopsis suaedae TaxID=2510978 RepID=UPI0013EF437A|nr:TetR/AcrR family transcriptional regulator C-terminal domain-containing protein [Amycolatopsis suaedae]
MGPSPDLREVPGGWRERLDRWAREIRSVFRRHPWALAVIADRRVMGPNEIAWFEAALAAVAPTGLPDRTVVDVVLLLNAYVRGAAQGSVAQARAERRTGVGADAWAAANAKILARVVDDDRYPVLAGILAAGALTPEDAAHEFEFGLTRVLDSIAALIDERARLSGRG